ncbi:MAG: hypothetical protein A2V93_12255 [Ignavibacteria bacterium RBG_16_34_14]|nr:MAG: hypothetical protein A2V93_12255 [Ignavibacteria bacterium RBG_16_34_14]
MKKGYFVFFLIILFVITIFAGADLINFNGYNQGEDIKIEWQTGKEINLKHFIIERKTTESNYSEIATIQPKGDNSFYSYLDETAYKQNDFVFIYRLKIEENSGTYSYSRAITVSPVQGVKRTWGSIKAMFR